MTNEFLYPSADEYQIYMRGWEVDGSVGSIQIAHGLGESSEYYEEFAAEANKHGFNVFINEAHGHGRTAGNISSDTYKLRAGDAGADGFHKMADDLYTLNLIIRKKYVNKPVFLLGHSMGSIVSQLFINRYSNTVAGLILIGLPHMSNIDELIESIQSEIYESGLKSPCKKTYLKMFKHVNEGISPIKTEIDWITGDYSKAIEILELPFTNILFNNEFYKDFLYAIKEVQNEPVNGLKVSLPILLLSGAKDAVSDNGSSTRRKYATFKKQGLTNVAYKIYDGMRHSLLQDIGRDIVANDILNWVRENLDIDANAG